MSWENVYHISTSLAPIHRSALKDKKGKITDSNTGEKLTAEARFFRAVAEDGVITVPPLNAEEVRS